MFNLRGLCVNSLDCQRSFVFMFMGLGLCFAWGGTLFIVYLGFGWVMVGLLAL